MIRNTNDICILNKEFNNEEFVIIILWQKLIIP